ncbi:PRC-barrel domain-containing protein [Jiella sp. CBK1P-4]|uniref:PRC-barrel domain-containing protein n=1 Tax=Jiella avicenniae TaxID=2907202 RepID=A0A9X1P1G9_9HYPH|nr:PRC-barrel domain-containing protein [Jiella avicenniae]
MLSTDDNGRSRAPMTETGPAALRNVAPSTAHGVHSAANDLATRGGSRPKRPTLARARDDGGTDEPATVTIADADDEGSPDEGTEASGRDRSDVAGIVTADREADGSADSAGDDATANATPGGAPMAPPDAPPAAMSETADASASAAAPEVGLTREIVSTTDLIAQPALDGSGSRIGTVADVLVMLDDARVRTVVIETEDGFLGLRDAQTRRVPASRIVIDPLGGSVVEENGSDDAEPGE